jgi:hypothetical protein
MFGGTFRGHGYDILGQQRLSSGQYSQKVPVQRLAYQRDFVLRNTIISCALGSNIDSVYIISMWRPAAKGDTFGSIT